MFGLLQSIMPLHARKQYPKPWLQQTRGSDIERSPKIFSSEKNRVPDMGGKCCEKKTESPLFVDSVFFQLWKKTESMKSEDSVFFQSISPPCLGLCFFSELKCSDFSLSYFLLYTGARVSVMASWHAMAL